jgi:hypothetical protein
VAAPEGADERALRAALPPGVGRLAPLGGGATSSVARVCHPGGARIPLLDSTELPGGLAACDDWQAAITGGLPTARALTAQLNAGPVVVGFVQLHFPAAARGARPPSRAALRELCDAVGGAIFVRRAFAVGGGGGGGGVGVGAGQGVGSSSGKPHIGTLRGTNNSLRVLHLSHSSTTLDTAISDADAAALAALDATSAGDAALLRSWTLDAWSLPDEEVQRLLVSMLHGLDLLRRFRIPPAAAHAFAADIASHMNANPCAHPHSHEACETLNIGTRAVLTHARARSPRSFHNLRHVFCVVRGPLATCVHCVRVRCCFD